VVATSVHTHTHTYTTEKRTQQANTEIVQKVCQECEMNREDAVDRSRWMKQIKDD